MIGGDDVTDYVALPFVFSDDGVAAGEPPECLNANAAWFGDQFGSVITFRSGIAPQGQVSRPA
ncbi:hypothetical protein AB4Z51_33320 [Bradyrhizobium sp. 2TAF36]|uniref:hypothetical protein n=1 Tax=Bradyrhizobium sp. 2TAF36 TaxID=3233016 RepID=UPI003F8E3D23